MWEGGRGLYLVFDFLMLIVDEEDMHSHCLILRGFCRFMVNNFLFLALVVKIIQIGEVSTYDSIHQKSYLLELYMVSFPDRHSER